IGWLGTSSNLIYLADIAEALAQAVSSAPGRRLVVVCDRDPELPGLDYEFRRWSPAVERNALAEFGVGIMPLRDDPWTRGKCAFKLIQYGAASIPVVASPVGMNRSVVKHGGTGYLASSPRQWAEALDRLLSDPRSRTEMGAAGRRLVEEEYSLEANLSRIVEVLEELVG
nr:glycosyltransferase [bacterium]